MIAFVVALAVRARPEREQPTPAPPASSAATADEPLIGDLRLQLDKQSFTQGEEITGTITFRVEWKDEATGRGRTRVWLGHPQIRVMMDESVAIETMTDTMLVDPVWIGHTYRFSFLVRASGTIQEYADQAGKKLRLARPGARRIAAGVSPTIGWWAGQIPRYDVLLYKSSDWTTFALTPGEGSFAEKPELLSWIESPPRIEGGRGLYSAYYRDPQQSLFGYYQFWKYPLRDLPLFMPPDSVVELETCARPPCFLLLRPGQEYTVRFTDGQQHNLFDGHSYTVLPSNGGVLQAPAWEGLFPIECKVHSHRVGWLLVATWATDTSGPHGP